MFKLKFLATVGVLFVLCISVSACTKSNAKSGVYVWNEVTGKAAFPQGYNYPVFVMNEKMFALKNGGWLSSDGETWTKTDLPESGLNSGYQEYVQFKNAIYALGTMQGNYLNMQLFSKIARTSDFKTWETLAEKANCPPEFFTARRFSKIKFGSSAATTAKIISTMCGTRRTA